MNREVHVRFWESAGLRCPAPLDYRTEYRNLAHARPRYDFNWQLEYDTSIKVPKGTKLRVDAHFDNSSNNKYNPNPSRDVFFGEQTWEEMMTGYVGVIVDDLSLDPRQLFEKDAMTRIRAAR